VTLVLAWFTFGIHGRDLGDLLREGHQRRRSALYPGAARADGDVDPAAIFDGLKWRCYP